MKKTITFKEFGADFRNYYKCKEVNIRNEMEAEVIFWDLYDCKEYEFNYDKKIIELYF